jgi:hypothetical protein
MDGKNQTVKPMEKITGHFRNKITGQMKSIHVPEWDLEIYFKEVNTLTEESKMLNLAQQGKTIEALVETLITKARDKDGAKLFRPADKVTLMNEADPNVVIRVTGEINSANADSNMEIAEKNLEEIQI